jgi:hypothetical protein
MNEAFCAQQRAVAADVPIGGGRSSGRNAVAAEPRCTAFPGPEGIPLALLAPSIGTSVLADGSRLPPRCARNTEPKRAMLFRKMPGQPGPKVDQRPSETRIPARISSHSTSYHLIPPGNGIYRIPPGPLVPKLYLGTPRVFDGLSRRDRSKMGHGWPASFRAADFRFRARRVW